MNIRKLHLLLAVSVLFLALSGIAHACDNLGCARPGAGSCYSCTLASGYNCSVSGACPTSCTESQCTGGGGDDPLITLAVPNLPFAPKTPDWKLKDTLLAAHFAPAVKPRQTTCGALALPKNVLFAL